MASRPFQFLEKKRSKIRKRAAKHFEGLAALSTHSAGRRAAVKTGCKPVHFSLDGCPLSCYFSGSVATTSGHFIHKSERRTKNGGVAPFGNPHKKGGTLPLHGAHTAFSCYPALRLYRLSKSQRGIGVVSLTMGNSGFPFRYCLPYHIQFNSKFLL